jgi:hypothetical protein
VKEVSTSAADGAAKHEIERDMDPSVKRKWAGIAPSGRLGSSEKSAEYSKLLNKHNSVYLEGQSARKDKDDVGRSAKVIADRIEHAPDKNRKRLQKSRLEKRAEVELTIQSKEDLEAELQNLTGDQFDQPNSTVTYNVTTKENEHKKPDPLKDHILDPAAKEAISRNAMLSAKNRGNEDEIKRVAKAETIKEYVVKFKNGGGMELTAGQQQTLKTAGVSGDKIKGLMDGSIRELKQASIKMPMSINPDTPGMSKDQITAANTKNAKIVDIQKQMKTHFKVSADDLIPGTQFSILGAQIQNDRKTGVKRSTDIQDRAIAAGQRISDQTQDVVETYGVKDDPRPELKDRKNR